MMGKARETYVLCLRHEIQQRKGGWECQMRLASDLARGSSHHKRVSRNERQTLQPRCDDKLSVGEWIAVLASWSCFPAAAGPTCKKSILGFAVFVTRARRGWPLSRYQRSAKDQVDFPLCASFSAPARITIILVSAGYCQPASDWLSHHSQGMPIFHTATPHSRAAITAVSFDMPMPQHQRDVILLQCAPPCIPVHEQPRSSPCTRIVYII